jgi:hypothetical protein
MQHEIKKREEKQLERLYKLASFPDCECQGDGVTVTRIVPIRRFQL